MKTCFYSIFVNCGGIMAKARLSGKKGSFEPSCEVGYEPGCFSF